MGMVTIAQCSMHYLRECRSEGLPSGLNSAAYPLKCQLRCTRANQRTSPAWDRFLRWNSANIACNNTVQRSKEGSACHKVSVSFRLGVTVSSSLWKELCGVRSSPVLLTQTSFSVLLMEDHPYWKSVKQTNKGKALGINPIQWETNKRDLPCF